MKPYYIIARGGRAEFLGVLRMTGDKIEKCYTHYIIAESPGIEKWREVPKDQVVFDPMERYESKEKASAVIVEALRR